MFSIKSVSQDLSGVVTDVTNCILIWICWDRKTIAVWWITVLLWKVSFFTISRLVIVSGPDFVGQPPLVFYNQSIKSVRGGNVSKRWIFQESALSAPNITLTVLHFKVIYSYNKWAAFNTTLKLRETNQTLEGKKIHCCMVGIILHRWIRRAGLFFCAGWGLIHIALHYNLQHLRISYPTISSYPKCQE